MTKTKSTLESQKKALRRLLLDFPELWAIQRRWDVGPNVSLPVVETMTDAVLEGPVGYEQWYLVMEAETSDGYFFCVGAPWGNQSTPILRVVLSLSVFGRDVVIKYVVSAGRDTVTGQSGLKYTIYKPPKGRTISDLLTSSK